MTTFVLPMALPSVANQRLHWSVKARQTKAQRSAVLLAMPTRKLQRERNWLTLMGKVVVTLTRCSPRPLDDDNNVGAFKGVRDQVAAQLGIDDRDKRVAWAYGQERGAQASARASRRQRRRAGCCCCRRGAAAAREAQPQRR